MHGRQPTVAMVLVARYFCVYILAHHPLYRRHPEYIPASPIICGEAPFWCWTVFYSLLAIKHVRSARLNTPNVYVFDNGRLRDEHNNR